MEIMINCFFCVNAHENSRDQHYYWSLPHYVSHAWAFWLDWLSIVGFSYNECISMECATFHTMEILMTTKMYWMLWTKNSRIWKPSKYISYSQKQFIFIPTDVTNVIYNNRRNSTKTHRNNKVITFLEQDQIDISFSEYISITFDIRSLLNCLIKIKSARGNLIFKSMLLEIANFIQNYDY